MSDTTINADVHVRDDTEIIAQRAESSTWLRVGPCMGHVTLFINSHTQINRMILALQDLMRLIEDKHNEENDTYE